MAYLENLQSSDAYKKSDTFLAAGDLDKKKGLSLDEGLAVGLVLHEFENFQSLPNWESNTALKDAMKNRLNEAYIALQKIKKGQPDPQIVYVDLSGFESSYDRFFKPFTKSPFTQWRGELIKAVEDKFCLPEGRKLNIAFVTEKPSKSSYTTVVLSSQSFMDFVNSSPQLKAKVVSYYRISEPERSPQRQKIQEIIARMTKSLPKDMPDVEKIAHVAKAPEFRDFLLAEDQEALAVTIKSQDFEFGNFTKDEVVWIDTRKVYLLLYLSLTKAPVRAPMKPWISEKPENVVEGFAEIVAHEVGHALGFTHSGQGMKRLGQGIPSSSNSRKVHLMDPSDEHFDRDRPSLPFFDDFSLAYLQRILAVKK